MAYSEKLAARTRMALSAVRAVEEKKIFGSLAFMVNGKMCIAAGPDRLMVRVDPAEYGDLIGSTGCKPVIMRGREYRGYIYVDEQAVNTEKSLDFWVCKALDYNKVAKSSKK